MSYINDCHFCPLEFSSQMLAAKFRRLIQIRRPPFPAAVVLFCYTLVYNQKCTEDPAIAMGASKPDIIITIMIIISDDDDESPCGYISWRSIVKGENGFFACLDPIQSYK